MKFIINNETINIVDAPATGTTGQVLTIDANGNPKWDNTSSDMSNYYTKSEINEMIPENNLTNIVNGSASGSVRGINTKLEDSSYEMGENAWAEGYDTMAKGKNSHAEGASTKASGDYSHAEGGGTTASGGSSHAEGGGTKAQGYGSHAEGGGTIAQGYMQHVMGEYNVPQGTQNSHTSSDYVFIVGNGTAQKPSNAFAMKWDGTFVFANGTEITPAQFASLLALLNN